jgi:hypothetical protein
MPGPTSDECVGDGAAPRPWPLAPLYARVDGVLREGRFLLMEVEVNEPGLGLDLAPGSAERFADALLARLPA